MSVGSRNPWLSDMVSTTVMVVSDNLEIQQTVASLTGQFGLAPILAPTVQEARKILSSHSISLIFCSDELPGGEIDNLIRETSKPFTKVPVVMVSRFDDWEPLILGPAQIALNTVKRDAQDANSLRFQAQ
jgi:DNA-binding response OmpR family regulator